MNQNVTNAPVDKFCVVSVLYTYMHTQDCLSQWYSNHGGKNNGLGMLVCCDSFHSKKKKAFLAH